MGDVYGFNYLGGKVGADFFWCPGYKIIWERKVYTNGSLKTVAIERIYTNGSLKTVARYRRFTENRC